MSRDRTSFASGTMRRPAGPRMTFRLKLLFAIAPLLALVAPSIATEFTYKEYAKASEDWKRGFVFGMSQYMQTVAQPDEEAPYQLRNAYQRCFAGSTMLLWSVRSRPSSPRILPARRSRWFGSSSGRYSICAGRKSQSCPSRRPENERPRRTSVRSRTAVLIGTIAPRSARQAVPAPRFDRPLVLRLDRRTCRHPRSVARPPRLRSRRAPRWQPLRPAASAARTASGSPFR